MSQVDQKRAFNKLKHDLEPWRDIIIQVDTVLGWEKKFYPAVIYATVSVFFLILWAMDLSTITMLALSALAAIAFDFGYPSVSRLVFGGKQWGGVQEAQFEEVCTQLCNLKATLGGWYEYLFNAKERKSTMFVILMSIVLLALAWIGAVINNLFLIYLISLFGLMYPGMQKKSVFKMVRERFGGVVNSKIQQFRDKKSN